MFPPNLRRTAFRGNDLYHVYLLALQFASSGLSPLAILPVDGSEIAASHWVEHDGWMRQRA
jgi:hypothetical protein